MLILSKNTKIKRRPYTYKEIVEMDFPDFWRGATEVIRIARELQNIALELLPECRKLLPLNYDQLKEQKAKQGVLLYYLMLRSTYAFAHKIGKLTNNYCHNLAKAKLTNDVDQVEASKKELVVLMTFVGKVSESSAFLTEKENGFDMLEKLIDTYSPKLHFSVLHNWSYRDITGTIHANGILSESLWQTVLEDDVPTDVNVEGLMERADDNELVVMY